MDLQAGSGRSRGKVRREAGAEREESIASRLCHESRHEFIVHRAVDQDAGAHDACLSRGNKGCEGNSIDSL
jgi:hypothetical protein